MGKWVYAVQRGRSTGVFDTWAEAERSVKGFPGARHRKFAASDQRAAHTWAAPPPASRTASLAPASADPPSRPTLSSSDDAPRKRQKVSTPSSPLYAVRRGRGTGLYGSWADVEPLVRSFPGAQYRKFPPGPTQQYDAQAFLSGPTASRPKTRAVGPMSSSATVLRALGPPPMPLEARTMLLSDDDVLVASSAQGSRTAFERLERYPDRERAVLAPFVRTEPAAMHHGRINVWCDGSSLANGQRGARAGWGVYFPSDSPYVGLTEARRLPGALQTNNRGELAAIGRACALLPDHEQVRIHTDSQYAIDALTIWANNWERNDWKTADGRDVQNIELIQWIRALMRKRCPQLVYTRGHAGDVGNEAADALARLGASLPEERIAGLPPM